MDPSEGWCETADEGGVLLPLLAVTNSLVEAESRETVCRVTADAGASVLGLPICGVYLVDDEELLEPVAVSDDTSELLGHELLEYVRGDDVVWEAFEAGETLVLPEEDGSRDRVPNPDTPVRSAIVVPVGAHGVFVSASPEEGAFTDRAVQAAELLAAATATALDRVERTEGLERQNERLQQLAGVISHDLTSPLAVARGWTDIARDADDPGEALDHVETALDRVATLVDDLVSLARTGVDDSERTRTDLGAVAEAAWANGVDAAGATLHVEDDTPTVMAVHSLVTQFFENLLGNAVEHGGPAPAVRVGPLADGGFYVADDGPGIPESERTKVFDHGYTTGDGTGFGLAIVDAVAEGHGWTVSVTESETGGARFEFRF